MPTWLKHSFYNVWRKPFRTGLVVLFLSLVVGLFTVMATVNYLAGKQFEALEGNLESTIELRPIGSLGLGGTRSQPLPFALVDEIQQMGAALRINPYLIRREFQGETTTFFVGTPPSAPLLAVGDPEPMDGRIIAGRVFDITDGDTSLAVIGLEVASRYGIEAQQLGQDTKLNIKGRDWRVIGIFDGGNGFTNNQVFLSMTAMRDAFQAQGLSRVVIQAPSAARGIEIAEQLAIRLSGQADVVTNRPAVALAQASLAGIGGATRTGAFVFFMVGALVVMGAMVLTFRDQLHEIGIEKALGASNAVLARRLLTESVLLTASGGLGGLVVAWFGLSIYARSWTSIKFGLIESPLSLPAAISILLVCIALGALGSLYPILRSRHLDPLTILREE